MAAQVQPPSRNGSWNLLSIKKLGAFARKTGKQEIKVSLRVMASNPFREFTRKEFEKKDDEDDDEDDDEMKVKTVRLSPREVLAQLVERCDQLRVQKLAVMTPDPAKWNERRDKAKKGLSDKDFSYLKQRSFDKKMALMQNSEPQVLRLQHEKIDGWDVPPRLDGKIVFSDLKKDHHKDALIEELRHRMALPAVERPGFLVFKKALMEHEKQLLRAEFPTADEEQIELLAKTFKPQCPGLSFVVVEKNTS